MTIKEETVGDGPKVMKFFRVPWPMRLRGNRFVPKGIVPTDDHEMQRLLSKAISVEELPADHPDVQTALAVRSAEVAHGGRGAPVLDRAAPDWREQARAKAAQATAEREQRRAAEARQKALQEAADRGDPEGKTVPPIEPAPPSPTPPVLAHVPDGLKLPDPAEALPAVGIPAAAGVFTPSAMEAGAAGGVAPEPDGSTMAMAPELAAIEAAKPAAPPSPAPENPTATPATLAAGEPEPGFAYMTKSQLREWLQTNTANIDVPSSASKSTMEKIARGALADLNRTRGK